MRTRQRQQDRTKYERRDGQGTGKGEKSTGRRGENIYIYGYLRLAEAELAVRDAELAED
jgi:hypothetical protein